MNIRWDLARSYRSQPYRCHLWSPLLHLVRSIALRPLFDIRLDHSGIVNQIRPKLGTTMLRRDHFSSAPLRPHFYRSTLMLRGLNKLWRIWDETKYRNMRECLLTNRRRFWPWKGATQLSKRYKVMPSSRLSLPFAISISVFLFYSHSF